MEDRRKVHAEFGLFSGHMSYDARYMEERYNLEFILNVPEI